ncbi:MAG: TetR/AcrR family transcriptional regulator [Bacteroidetes bacterium]|jgi:AcrR family transcriptional regulator|nr:TetR/AcrR family transcriptional regulator [Bacteroidota bacterium]
MEMTENKRRAGRPVNSETINKETILKIALEAFAEFGFEGVSVKTIAKRAKINDSLMHYHFGSKIELWKKAIETSVDKYEEERKKTLRLYKGEDLVIIGKALIRHFIYFMAENIELHQIVVHEMTQKTERTDWVIKIVLEPIAERIEEYRTAFLADREPIFKMSTASYFSLAYGMSTTFFTMQHLADKRYGVNVFEEKQIEEHVDLVTEIVFATLYKQQ